MLSLAARSRAFALALLVAACAAREERRADSTGDRAGGETFVVATTVDLGGVNELISGGVRFSHEILDLLFLGLLEEQPDAAGHPPGFEPSLAEQWELSPDRRELTFRLRTDARWSDGTAITAKDVLFTYSAQRSEEVAWVYSDAKDAIAEVVALDERTVRFRFREPYPYQLVDVNDGRVLPEHAWGPRPFADWRSSGDWFREHLVTSGPFHLTSWQPGIELILERNPLSFAADLAGPERVVFRVVPDPAALVEQLLAGRFDFADGLSPSDALRIRKTASLRLISTPSRQFDYIAWNLRRAPFAETGVRRALALAIDRQALVEALWGDWARVAVGPIPFESWARDRELAPLPYDPARARLLLAEAGYADSDRDGLLERQGEPFRFELSTNSGNRQRSDALVLVQEQLRRVGIEAVPRLYEIQTLTEKNLAGDFDATLAGWSVDTTLDLRPYFHSREIAAGWNFIAYSNPEVDRLLDEIRNVPALDLARPLFVRLQRLLHEEQPYAFLWEPSRLAAVRRGIAGVEPNSLSALASLPRWRRLGTALE